MRMPWPRRLLATVAAAGLLLAIPACGSSGSGGGSSDANTVVWYTTFSSDDVSPMIAAFNKKYPKIKVQALRLSANQLPTRIFTEQKGGKYNADVVSGESVYVSQLFNAGSLAPYTPPDQPPLPKGLSLPSGFRGLVYANTTVIAYNPAAVKAHHLQPPTSWQDLTKPQWRGQFSIDPEAVNFYQSMIATMGHAKAFALMKGLGNNHPPFVESHTEALTQVQSGEPLATATAYGYKAADLKKDTPGKLAFVNAKPLPTSLSMIDLVKNAPHPDAAKTFIDWMESKQGQQQVVNITNHVSLRPGVSNDSAVWDPAKWPPIWVGALTPKVYNQYVKEYAQALHAP